MALRKTLISGDISFNNSVEFNSSMHFDGNIPIGGIIMYNFPEVGINSLPRGWVLCDGADLSQNCKAYTDFSLNKSPDLRGRFVMCSTFDESYISNIIGYPNNEVSGISGEYLNNEIGGSEVIHDYSLNTSTEDISGVNNLPPYYVLAYIMRVD